MFIMIDLGEGIITLATPALKTDQDIYTFVVVGFFIFFCLAILYFEVCPMSNRLHALTSSREAGVVWLLFHPILGLAIFFSAASIKELYYDLRDGKDVNDHNMWLSASLFASTLSLIVLRLTHLRVSVFVGEEPHEQMRVITTYVIRFAIAFGHMAFTNIRYLGPLEANVIMIIHGVLIFLSVLLEVIKYRFISIEKYNVDTAKSSFSKLDEEHNEEGRRATVGAHLTNRNSLAIFRASSTKHELELENDISEDLLSVIQEGDEGTVILPGTSVKISGPSVKRALIIPKFLKAL
jgi:hypothetical protein